MDGDLADDKAVYGRVLALLSLTDEHWNQHRDGFVAACRELSEMPLPTLLQGLVQRREVVPGNGDVVLWIDVLDHATTLRQQILLCVVVVRLKSETLWPDMPLVASLDLDSCPRKVQEFVSRWRLL